jgi:hypothetical protein
MGWQTSNAVMKIRKKSGVVDTVVECSTVGGSTCLAGTHLSLRFLPFSRSSR